jgi:hypothetical protein
LATSLRFTPFPIPGLAAIAAALGFRSRGQGRWRMPQVEPTLDAAPPRSERVERMLAVARTRPDLQMIEWDAESGLIAPVAPAPEQVDVAALESRRRKLRDRYIAARFPGLARGGADLADCAAMIDMARLLFEDGRAALALELLELCASEAPTAAAPRLAALELRFLQRDAAGFVAAARAFNRSHPDHEAWEEVTRLGRALAPAEALFGAATAARAHEHYGPWPHLPNWIQAPWDLTAEVCAADFHRALALS